MTRVTILANPTAEHQASHARAMAEGFAAHGIAATVRQSGPTVPTSMVACWGWRLGQRLRNAGHEVLVMERGYLGDRFKWTSLGWNGLNGYATAPEASDPPGQYARFEMHFGHLLKPWNPDGRYVLLIGQVPGDASLRGRDMGPWYEDAAKRAAEAYGLPVRFRAHPMALVRGMGRKVVGAQSLAGELEAALAGAAVVVTYNSNTGVDAVLAGKPIVAEDAGSMAWPVAAHQIGEGRDEPDRLAWARRLAWRQFTMDEIRSGFALDVVGALEAKAA